MDSLSQKKITEAKQHVSEAEKAMKTSLFKRKPDLDTAADSYSKASTCYKTAKDLQNAIQCSLKSAECYEQNNSLFNAAKQHEQIGMMANEIKNYSLVFESFHKSAELMITNGTRDSAGILLERGANMLKLNDPESSLKLMRRAIQVGEVEDKDHQLVTLYENCINIALRIEKLNEAVELIDKSMDIMEKVGSAEQIIKYLLTVCLIYLYRDDWVSAKNYLEKMKQRFSIVSRADDLLEMYEEKDDEKFKELIKNYLSYAVDNEALKLANKITKTKEWIASVESQKAEKNKPSHQQTYHEPTYQENLSNSNTSSNSQSYDSKQNKAQDDENEEEFADGLL